MNGDLKAAVTLLAADNARLCDIALAAEQLEKAVRECRYLRSTMPTLWSHLENAANAFAAVRNGQ
jgi:hypothetical protein